LWRGIFLSRAIINSRPGSKKPQTTNLMHEKRRKNREEGVALDCRKSRKISSVGARETAKKGALTSNRQPRLQPKGWRNTLVHVHAMGGWKSQRHPLMGFMVVNTRY
jgi:hypothetical protein